MSGLVKTTRKDWEHVFCLLRLFAIFVNRSSTFFFQIIYIEIAIRLEIIALRLEAIAIKYIEMAV